MAVDFREMLKRPVMSVERPRPIPAGSYIAVQKSYKYDVARYKAQDGSEIPIVRFTLQIQSATDDVPPELLEGIKDLTSRIVSKEYELTDERGLWGLRQYLEAAGAEGLENGRSFHEAVEADTNNKAYLIEVTATPSKKNPDDVFNNVGKVGKVT